MINLIVESFEAYERRMADKLSAAQQLLEHTTNKLETELGKL
jgi:hypothetical protein